MGVFTEREREEFNKSSHATGATSEFVRQQQERKTDDEFRNNDLTSLLQRAAQESLRRSTSLSPIFK
jgi:hypothetical protein